MLDRSLRIIVMALQASVSTVSEFNIEYFCHQYNRIETAYGYIRWINLKANIGSRAF